MANPILSLLLQAVSTASGHGGGQPFRVCSSTCSCWLSSVSCWRSPAILRTAGFASVHGPAFYGLPRNPGTVTLRRESWTPPESYPFGDAVLKPLAGGEALAWRLVH